MTDQHVAWLTEPDPIMVTKANVRTRVHRRAYMDYVGVKLYREGGEVSGELRIVGLFTSMALATPHTEVPLIRRKVSEVMRRSGYEPDGHAGKALMAALDTYPRDELFQIGGDKLFEFATRHRGAGRPAARARAAAHRPLRQFRLGPRLRAARPLHLAKCAPTSATISPRSMRAASRPTIRTSPKATWSASTSSSAAMAGAHPRPNRDDLEDAVTDLILTFGDRLQIADADTERHGRPWLDAFSAAYQSRNTAERGAGRHRRDQRLLEGETSLALKLVERSDGDGAYGLKVYHRGKPDPPVGPRADARELRLPRHRRAHLYGRARRPATTCYIHDMVLDDRRRRAPSIADRAPLIEDAILAVWQTEAESDGLNQLTARAPACAWYDVAILRALARYLKQVGVTWFARLSGAGAEPAPRRRHGAGDAVPRQIASGFSGNRDTAPSHGARGHRRGARGDAVARRRPHHPPLSSIWSTRRSRTNAFQRDGAGSRRPALAIKFDCRKVDGLPEPRRCREIFVYSRARRGHPSARRPDCARRPALVRPAARTSAPKCWG